VNGIVFVADEDTSSPKLEALADNQVRLRDALRRYLGDNVADMVDARPSFVDVGGQTQTVRVVHADVRGYTEIAEQLPPDRVVSLLQGQAKAVEVVCSAVVLQAAGEGVRTTPLGALELKGRKTPVEAHRVEGIDQ